LSLNLLTILSPPPGHRWLNVTAYGQPAGFKVLAAAEAEAAAELDRVISDFSSSDKGSGAVTAAGSPIGSCSTS